MSDQPYAGMYAVCPVCNKRILLEKQAKAFLRISHLVPWFLSHQALLEAVVKGSFHDSHSGRDKIHWACDDCIELERALLANPAEQTFCDSAPYYAYFDLCFDCRTCGKRFQFSAREQKFWYETRKFWVQSQPKDCVECRRERRKRKQRHSPKENTGDNNDLRTDSA